MRKSSAPAPAPSAKPRPDAARRRVADVVQRHAGERPRRLEPLTGGLNNHVYRADMKDRRLVARLHDEPGKIAVYRKEAWAMARAREAGVPVPTVLEVGEHQGRPFMILEEVPGIPGTHWSDTVGVLRQLGELAARLHRTRTHGYGRDGAEDGRQGWPRWADYLDREMCMGERLRILDDVNALPGPQRDVLEGTLAQMRRWSRPPVLQHGDLRLKNTIVSPEDGTVVALIDWEDCISAPPPHWDLAIALHDVGPDEKQAFIEGYGLSPAQFARIAPELRALNMLNYAWAMRHALADGDRARTAWLKARLRGVFDLSM